MDRGRQARSVSRSRTRRDDRRRESLHSSHESLAGNLSPGRHHPGNHSHRREGSSGGFFKNLFGRRDKHGQDIVNQQQYQQQYQQVPGDVSSPRPAPPASSSPGAKLKALFSRSPQGKSPRNASPAPARGPVEELQVKELQHHVQLLKAELEGYEKIKQQLQAEQRAAQEWKEKWNYQNFKLNLMVDMLVLRVLELEQPSAT
ncbi:hypothetical protein Vretimale_9461 [Volvox reticuliferus]|uniref:Uncharacterized protein n=1 Tax=Volvox reticuliferus TaxID=1737510 RepID=A0A8J4D201_9CHLO|nr:hypothetical protein Vretifemale_18707 [Volvox reticuliferus]GIM05000.1 hypothetical protein Vretimale_9461 [Volvox reticuliferus]